MAQLDRPGYRQPQSGDEAIGPRARLVSVRVMLVAVAFVLVLAVFVFSLPVYFALASFFFIAASAFFPARPSPGHLLARRDDRGRAWPDDSMKSLTDALPMPAFILDGAGVVRHPNSEATRRFPATRSGDPFSLTFRSPALVQSIRSAAEGKTASVDYHDHGDEAGVYAIAVSALPQPVGGRNLVLVILEDVSERQAIDRMRADFVANASHELRTPLASLTGYIETLQGPARGDDEATDRFLSIMREQAERMRRLIDDLLSLSQLEMRAHRMPESRLDLVTTVRGVLDSMAPLAAELSVETSLDAPDLPVEVTGERDELVQVFENLIENGLKYGGSGGRLEVAIVSDDAGGGAARTVTVRDYGPGVTAEHLPRLTERFYRVDAEASREKQGTGLGLAIVKHILTHYRAELDFDSQPGAGLTAKVSFPPPGLSKDDKNK